MTDAQRPVATLKEASEGQTGEAVNTAVDLDQH